MVDIDVKKIVKFVYLFEGISYIPETTKMYTCAKILSCTYDWVQLSFLEVNTTNNHQKGKNWNGRCTVIETLMWW